MNSAYCVCNDYLEKLYKGDEPLYESENINFTFALTKCTFLRFHRDSRV